MAAAASEPRVRARVGARRTQEVQGVEEVQEVEEV